jgi:hypothetical protein
LFFNRGVFAQTLGIYLFWLDRDGVFGYKKQAA